MRLLNWHCTIWYWVVFNFLDMVSAQINGNATPSVQQIPDWSYRGCYHDSSVARILNNTSYDDSKNNDVVACASFCKGWVFFGVEAAGQCFCGNSIASSKPGIDSRCNATCPADATVICGGFWGLSIYEALQLSPKQSAATTSGPSLSPTQAPTSSSVQPSSRTGDNDGSSGSSNKIAVGIGLGLGLPMLIMAAVTLGLKCSSMRRRRTRESPEEALITSQELRQVTEYTGPGLPASTAPADSANQPPSIAHQYPPRERRDPDTTPLNESTVYS